MASCAQTGDSTALILPYANKLCMQLFLEQLSRDNYDHQVILQVDGAAWHTSSKLNIPGNIHFIFQPPYSPELNPMEAVWDYIKENFFRNRFFESMQALENYLCVVVKNLMKEKNVIKSIVEYPFIKNACSNAI